jgi:hypothetical protein
MVNVRPAAAYRYVYPFEEQSLKRLAYYFDFDYADGREPEKYTAELNRAIEKWHAHQKDGTLRSMSGNGRLTLFDGRASAKQAEIVLEGAWKVVYELCEEGQSEGTIVRAMKEEGVGEEEVKGMLKELVEKRVMVEVDGKYLSVALEMSEEGERFIEEFAQAVWEGVEA